MIDDSHDLIGAYAMDALDADDAAAFERHLRSCPTCPGELIELREGLAGLADSYQVEPPATLRASVLDAVADLSRNTPGATADVPAAPVGIPEPLPGDAPHGAAPSEETPELPDTTNRADLLEPGRPGPLASVTPLPRRAAGSPPQRSRWQVLVAAAVALIAVLGVSVWQPWARPSVTAADVLSAADAVRASGTAEGGGGVTLVRSNRLGRAVLVTEALPDAPSGKVRQAWIQRPDGAMVSGGLMPAGTNVTMLLEGDARDAKGAGISVEPPGGSPQPGPVVLVLVGL